MSRLTSNEVRGLMEAYQEVYTPQELTEEQVWEEVEEWVNALVEEGYDLSDYTWEEMYESYITEAIPLAIPAAASAAPYILPALGAAAGVAKGLMNRGRAKNTPEQERWLNTGSFKAKVTSSDDRPQTKTKRETPSQRRQKIQRQRAERQAANTRPEASTTQVRGRTLRNTPNPSQLSAANRPGAASSSGSSGSQKPPEDPLKTVKDLAGNIPKIWRQTLGDRARERFFGTTRAGQVTRGATVAGVSALDIGGKAADPSKPSALSTVGSLGPGAVGTTLQGVGNIPGIRGTSLGTGARGTGATLRQVGREMRDQTKTTTSTPPTSPRPQRGTPPSQPPLNGVTRGPRGGVILNQVEVDCDLHIVEAEAQVAPITGSAGKEWMQKGKDGKWYPITDPELAKKSKQRWERESKKSEPEIGSTNAQGKFYTGPKFRYQSWQTATAKRLLPSEVLGSEPPKKASSTPAASAQPAPAKPAPAPAPAPAKPAPAPAKPLETRMSSVTGKREFVGTTADGTKFERRAATGAELRAAQAARKAALVSKPEDKKGAEKEAVKAGVGASRPSGAPSSSTSTSSSPIQAPKPASSAPAPKPVKLPVVPFKDSYEYDAYDLVLEYLLSQGHAGTLEEANYVMLEMDAEMIGDIVEVMTPVPSVTIPNKKEQTPKGRNKPQDDIIRDYDPKVDEK